MQIYESLLYHLKWLLLRAKMVLTQSHSNWKNLARGSSHFLFTYFFFISRLPMKLKFQSESHSQVTASIKRQCCWVCSWAHAWHVDAAVNFNSVSPFISTNCYLKYSLPLYYEQKHKKICFLFWFMAEQFVIYIAFAGFYICILYRLQFNTHLVQRGT